MTPESKYIDQAQRLRQVALQPGAAQVDYLKGIIDERIASIHDEQQRVIDEFKRATAGSEPEP